MGAQIPIVVIVGRPNVGKSTLFNRLVRARRAIVDDTPGVTRDWIVAPTAHEGRALLCVDTGGLIEDAAGEASSLAARVREQTLGAIGEADLVLCVFDGRAGAMPADADIVRTLRRSGKRVLFAVNKIDGAVQDALEYDFHALGIPRLHPVSAAHGRGIRSLLDAVVAALGPTAAAPEPAPTATRLALMGRPNVGKSSLLNRLLGQARAIVAPEPGTTRDPIDTPLTVGDRRYVLIDTAGIRRRGRVRDVVERHGAVRALGTLARTDLALVVLDAGEGMTEQDARIVGRAWEAGRGILLVANKWDTVAPAERRSERFRRRLGLAHPGLAGLPLVCVSARTGEGLATMLAAIARLEDAYGAQLATPALNRALRTAVRGQPPPSAAGRAIRLLYATQTERRPPTVSIFTSRAGTVSATYQRFLAGRLGAAFGLVGVPLRLRFLEAPRSRRARERSVGTPRRARKAGRAPRR